MAAWRCRGRWSWSEAAKRFGASWDKVRLAVPWVVPWGLEHRNLDGVDSLGIDSLGINGVAYGNGHKYMTLVYDICAGSKRLLWFGDKRTKATIKPFFVWFGPERCGTIRFVRSDIWPAYIHVSQQFCPNSLLIGDRFHIVKKFKQAVDKT